jgi:hypothetical protein
VRFGNVQRAPAMHIVLIAWLYVTLTMALTMDTLIAGLAFFALLGLAPALIVVLLAARRARDIRDRRRDSTSSPER